MNHHELLHEYCSGYKLGGKLVKQNVYIVPHELALDDFLE